jgi:phosphatidylinositol-3-phosphatase
MDLIWRTYTTMDSDEFSDGPIGMFIVSPFAKAGYSNSIHYTHGSTLRTLQEIFGVTPAAGYRFLGDAANETDLRDLFAAFP